MDNNPETTPYAPSIERIHKDWEEDADCPGKERSLLVYFDLAKDAVGTFHFGGE
jgi:hypothetical protein